MWRVVVKVFRVDEVKDDGELNLIGGECLIPVLFWDFHAHPFSDCLRNDRHPRTVIRLAAQQR